MNTVLPPNTGIFATHLLGAIKDLQKRYTVYLI